MQQVNSSISMNSNHENYDADSSLVEINEKSQKSISKFGGWMEWKIIRFFRGNQDGPKLYMVRWVILLIFTLAMFSSVLAQSTFSAVG